MQDIIRNLFPKQRIFNKKALLIIAFFIGWSFYYLPFFENIGQRRFFTYDLSVWMSFLGNTRLNSLVNHFFAQFFVNPVGIVITQVLLSSLFLACSYRTGGRYAVFMLPLWLILAPSTDNLEQDFNTGIILNMIALGILFAWISFREANKQSSRFYYEVFYLKYWIYYVLAGCALFYFCGITALLFLGTIVIYRLFILLFSIGRNGTGNVDSAAIAFGIYLITGIAITFVFPKQLHIPSFMMYWGWLKWSAFTLFFIALTANLLQSTSTRNLYRPHSSGWPLVLSGIAVGIFFSLLNGNELKRELVLAENACVKGQYDKIAAIGTRYFLNNPQPDPHAKRPELSRRYALGAYTRLALLMEGNLNSDFFLFRDVPEMQGMFPATLPLTHSSNFAYAKLYYETELYGSALPLMVYTLDHKDYENRVFRILVPIEAASCQRPLLKKHLSLLKKSMGNRKFALQWERINQESIDMGIPDGASPIGMGFVLNPTQTATDKLIRQKVEKGLFETDILSCSWYNDRNSSIAETINIDRPVNLSTLDYYSMLCLLEGDLEKLPVLVAHYAELEAPELPAYIQEAVLIRTGLPEHPEQKNTLSTQGYMGFRIDPEIIDRCIKISRILPIVDDNRGQIEHLYGNSYTYYYLTHINPAFPQSPLALRYCPDTGE